MTDREKQFSEFIRGWIRCGLPKDEEVLRRAYRVVLSGIDAVEGALKRKCWENNLEYVPPPPKQRKSGRKAAKK